MMLTAIGLPLFIIVASASGQTPPLSLSDTSQPLEVWRELMRTPRERIVEPLALMHFEAQQLSAVSQRLVEKEMAAGEGPCDPEVWNAQINALRLAISIRGENGTMLRSDAERMLSPACTQDLWALGERTILYLDESQDIEGKWHIGAGYDLNQRRRAYHRCYAESPLSIPIAKRLIGDALDENSVSDLETVEARLREFHRQHPLTSALEGRVRARSTIGKAFSADLRTVDGGAIHLPAVDRVTLFVIVGADQTPSIECLKSIRLILESVPQQTVSVIAGVVAKDAVTAREFLRPFDFLNGTVLFDREWREPFLKSYDIRSLPTIMIVDSNGKLNSIVRPNNWRVDLERPLAQLVELQ